MKESFEYYDEETGFFVFIPGDDFKRSWHMLAAEADFQRDIDFELLLDEIQLFEVGESYEKNET